MTPAYRDAIKADIMVAWRVSAMERGLSLGELIVMFGTSAGIAARMRDGSTETANALMELATLAMHAAYADKKEPT
jgi:hypothetical protein